MLTRRELFAGIVAAFCPQPGRKSREDWSSWGRHLRYTSSLRVRITKKPWPWGSAQSYFVITSISKTRPV